MDFDLTNLTEDEMMDKLAKDTKTLKVRLNISAEGGAEPKLRKLLEQQHMVS